MVGTSGSGKTVLARRLADRLGVPHVELDALYWGPGWTEPPPDQFRARVAEAIAPEAWVVDGNYLGKLGDLVLARADLVVWLDPPLRTILPRLLRRTLSRMRAGTELWSSNRETFRNAFLARDSLLRYAIRTHRKRRRAWPARLARYEHVRLRSAGAAEEWLARPS